MAAVHFSYLIIVLMGLLSPSVSLNPHFPIRLADGLSERVPPSVSKTKQTSNAKKKKKSLLECFTGLFLVDCFCSFCKTWGKLTELCAYSATVCASMNTAHEFNSTGHPHCTGVGVPLQKSRIEKCVVQFFCVS